MSKTEARIARFYRDDNVVIAVPPIIGVYAPSGRSGKGVVAQVLTDYYGYHTVKFAAPIRLMWYAYAAYCGLGDDEIERTLDGDLKEVPQANTFGLCYRTFGETQGTNWGRATIDKRLWINCAKPHVDAALRRGLPVVIDDLRFPNEATAIRDWGGKLLCVIRPEENGGRGPEYPSEGLLGDVRFDATVINHGSLKDIEQQVCEIVAGWS